MAWSAAWRPASWLLLRSFSFDAVFQTTHVRKNSGGAYYLQTPETGTQEELVYSLDIMSERAEGQKLGREPRPINLPVLIEFLASDGEKINFIHPCHHDVVLRG